MKLLNKIMLLLLALTPFATTMEVKAQDAYAQEKELITKVKRAPDTYVFAEATAKTEEEAQAIAEDLFYQNVNEYVASEKKMQGAADVVINDAKALQNSVTMPRGSNMHRVFIYVKKTDILAVKNPIVMSERLKQMTNEEKAKQEAKQKAKQEEEKRISAEAEAKVRAEYTAKQKAAEEAKAKKAAELAQRAMEDSIVKALAAQDFPEAATKLAEAKNITQLNTMLKQMKQKGEVKEYAKYKDIAVKSDWYFVLYDATGKVKAVLTDGDERMNVMTGHADSLKNYPQHAAVGVKFRK